MALARGYSLRGAQEIAMTQASDDLNRHCCWLWILEPTLELRGDSDDTNDFIIGELCVQR